MTLCKNCGFTVDGPFHREIAGCVILTDLTQDIVNAQASFYLAAAAGDDDECRSWGLYVITLENDYYDAARATVLEVPL
jgi:hypothetical protein